MSFQGDSIYWVEVEKIVPNPYQPRREFDEHKLKELSESVRMYGILQPLTVTRKEVQGEDGSFRSEYELIAGERRLRASKLAGLVQVPVIIRDGEQTEQEKLELAIIENLQREDLNAVDRALAFRQLVDVFSLSMAEVGRKVGRSREYVSNTVRLLALPDYMLNSLRAGDISEGHARTLLMLNDRPEEQDVVYREILLKKLSVREVERIARNIATEKVRKKENIDTELIEMEKQFTETLGTRVSIVKTDYGGRLTIDYFSVEDLETMLNRMKDEEQGRTKLAVELPTVGSLREEMELLEDKETQNALEILSEQTGIVTAPTENGPEPVISDNQPHTDIQVRPNVVPAMTPQPIVPVVSTSVASTTEVLTKATLAPDVKKPNPLRAQLASLLGMNAITAAAVASQPEIPPTPASVKDRESAPAAERVESAVESILDSKLTEKSDEPDDLYSVTKFTI